MVGWVVWCFILLDLERDGREDLWFSLASSGVCIDEGVVRRKLSLGWRVYIIIKPNDIRIVLLGNLIFMYFKLL